MLTTDKYYDKAIKDKIREFKPLVNLYVNGSAIYYNTPEVYETSGGSDINNTLSIFNNDGKYNKYASLEENYTQLDGTFILPNRNFDNEYAGIIGGVGTADISIVVNNTDISKDRWIALGNKQRKIIIDFGEEYPINFKIKAIPVLEQLSSGEIDILDEREFEFTNNSSNLVILEDIVQESEIPGGSWTFVGCKKLEFVITEWSNPNHRIKIRSINKGIVILFEGNEIVNIKYLEQTSLFNDELPSNSLSITLNNYDKKFNLLDYGNLYNSMDSNSHVMVNMGINTENGWEYIPIGYYPFGSYKNNNDMTTELDFIGAVEKNLETENQYLTTTASHISVVRGLGIYNYIDISSFGTINIQKTDYSSNREQAQAIGLLTSSFIKQSKEKITMDNNDRERTLGYYKLDTTKVKNIDDSIELKYPDIEIRNRIKQIKINSIKEGTLSSEYTTIFDDNVMNDSVDEQGNTYSMIDVKMSEPISTSTNDIQGFFDGVREYSFNPTRNEYELYFKNHSPSEQTTEHVEIKVKKYEITNNIYIFNNNVATGDKIEYNNNLFNSKSEAQTSVDYLYSIDKEYAFNLEILGDLSLEVGDIIYFSTPYYKNMYGIISSIDTTFNGGLTQIIKGVCSDAI